MFVDEDVDKGDVNEDGHKEGDDDDDDDGDDC